MSRGVASFCRPTAVGHWLADTAAEFSMSQLALTRTRTTGAAVVLMDLAGWRLDVNPHETLPA